MTKIRTSAQLQDVLDRDLGWRIKEIHALRVAARSAEAGAQRTFLRAGVALLYAHWEGFVKSAADNYVNYLSCQGVPYRQLRTCFVALGLKGSVLDVVQGGRFASSTAAVDFILGELDSPAKLPMRDAVDTESNLGSAVFRNITGWIGLDADPYSTHFHFLDHSLLRRRNRIAHGEYLDVDAAAFESLVDETILLVRRFKTDIENALVLKAYLREQAA